MRESTYPLFCREEKIEVIVEQVPVIFKRSRHLSLRVCRIFIEQGYRIGAIFQYVAAVNRQFILLLTPYYALQLMTDRNLRAMDLRHTLPNLKNLLLTLTSGESALPR